MELYRDENGFLDISDYKDGYDYFEFDHDGKHYYYKNLQREDFLYSELIAEEIAKEIGIEHCHYDLATIGDGLTGVISESREAEYDQVMPIRELFRDIPSDNTFSYNLEDIWDIMSLKYNNQEVVSRFINDLVKLFMFDIVIANPDRNSSNALIGIKDGIPYLYPAFDNGIIASDSSIKRGYYTLGVDKDSTIDIVKDFLKVSASEYKDQLSEYVEVISPDNMENIFERVENRIHASIPMEVKVYFLRKFTENHENIQTILNVKSK